MKRKARRKPVRRKAAPVRGKRLLKRSRRSAGGKRKLVKRGIKFTQVAVNKMLDDAHSNGYKEGFKDGLKGDSYQEGHEEGYKKGLYAGGDAIVDTHLPFDAILPDHSIEQIIDHGLEALRSQWVVLQNAEQVCARITAALNEKTPFSLVRLGDGEVLTLSQEVVLSVEQVRKEGPFLAYAGVDVPDLAAGDQLVAAIRQATVVGIPKLRNFTYQPLAIQTFRAHGLDYRSLSLTHSLVNYYIHKEGRLRGLLEGRQVLLVGDKSPELAGVLTQHGIAVSGVVSPVHGVKDVPRVMQEIARHSFDIALVAAGISAVLIAQRIATEMGKVALDFGHLADALAKGTEPFQ